MNADRLSKGLSESIRQEIEQGNFPFQHRIGRHSSHTSSGHSSIELAMQAGSCTRPAVGTIRFRPTCGFGAAMRSISSMPSKWRSSNERLLNAARWTRMLRPFCPATRTCKGRSRFWRRIIGWPTAKNCSATGNGCADCRRRVNVLPLGAAALAGTTLPIDRHDVARRLGFMSMSPSGEQGRAKVRHRNRKSRPTVSMCRAIAISSWKRRLCLADDCRTPEHLGGGMDFVEHGGVQFSQAAAGHFAPAARSCRKRSIPTCWS